jgi:hypothetical protein
MRVIRVIGTFRVSKVLKGMGDEGLRVLQGCYKIAPWLMIRPSPEGPCPTVKRVREAKAGKRDKSDKEKP